MQGRKGTPWAQPGFGHPPPPTPTEKKKRKRGSLNRDSASLRAQPAPWVAFQYRAIFAPDGLKEFQSKSPGFLGFFKG